MKTITFSINPTSFLLGIFTMGVLLLLANFTPAHKTQSGVDSPGVDSPGVDSPGVDSPGVDSPGVDSPGVDSPGVDSPGVDSPGVDSPGVDLTDPTPIDTRRFQVVVGQTETVILDTQTGRFVLSPKYIGQPRWVKGDFEELQSREKK